MNLRQMGPGNFCRHGHELTPDNVDPYALRYRGYVRCIKCRRERQRRYERPATPEPRRTLPPPAEQPRAPYELSAAELAEERRASERRQRERPAFYQRRHPIAKRSVAA